DGALRQLHRRRSPRRPRPAGEAAMTAPVLLEVENLSIAFPTESGLARAVEDVSFVLHEGETMGIVGESGSGKSMTAMAIMGILPRNATVTGSIRFRGRELVGLSDDELREIRG